MRRCFRSRRFCLLPYDRPAPRCFNRRRFVWVIFCFIYRHMRPEGSRQRRAFANIPILSQTGILGPSIRRAPMSPSPSDPRAKGEKTDKGKKDKGKNKGKYILGLAHPPSFLLSFPASSPGGLLVVTMHLILVSQDRLSSLLLPQPLDRAGPQAFPPARLPYIFPHLLACGAHARRLVKRW